MFDFESAASVSAYNYDEGSIANVLDNELTKLLINVIHWSSREKLIKMQLIVERKFKKINA